MVEASCGAAEVGDDLRYPKSFDRAASVISRVDVFDISRETSTIYEVWGEPRMYGVTLSLSW